MLCKFDRIIYPRGVTTSINGFMIAVYKPCGILRDAAGNVLSRFKAVGYYLPVSGKLQYRMEGRWTKSAQHGLQFEVARYEEVIAPTKEGVIHRILFCRMGLEKNTITSVPKDEFVKRRT